MLLHHGIILKLDMEKDPVMVLEALLSVWPMKQSDNRKQTSKMHLTFLLGHNNRNHPAPLPSPSFPRKLAALPSQKQSDLEILCLCQV